MIEAHPVIQALRNSDPEFLLLEKALQIHDAFYLDLEVQEKHLQDVAFDLSLKRHGHSYALDLSYFRDYTNMVMADRERNRSVVNKLMDECLCVDREALLKKLDAKVNGKLFGSC